MLLLVIFIILNKYIVLHPRHKLEYFKTARWEKEWITAAVDIVRDEFQRSYADREVNVDHFKPPKTKDVSDLIINHNML